MKLASATIEVNDVTCASAPMKRYCLLCFGANEVNDVTCASAPMKRMMSLVLRRQ
jgi:hypothetical protein